MQLINKLIPSLLAVMILTACSSEMANVDTESANADTEFDPAVAQAEADILEAQAEMANITLPFVGQLYFDFVGANDTMMGINIDPNGHTTLEMYVRDSSLKMYEGMYSPMMPGFDGENYYAIIGKDAIAQLDSEGKLMYGADCNIEAGKPCVTNLFE